MNKRNIYVGFDPGGDEAFGWAVLAVNESGDFETRGKGTCSSAVKAFKSAFDHCAKDIPAAVGIDAPLHWVEENGRPADQRVRDAIKATGKGTTQSVLAVNSLRGACLAQGIIVARLARRKWKGCVLAEAHPKALGFVDPEVDEKFPKKSFGSDHERDAILSAYSAWKSFDRSSGWMNMRESKAKPIKEDEPSVRSVEFFCKPIPVYFFPEKFA